MSNEAARANLLRLLADGAISRIRFNVGDVGVTPGLFSRVAQAVREAHIDVRHVPTLVRSGIYNSTENRFYLRRDVFPDIAAQALVVHEACHAGFDIASRPPPPPTSRGSMRGASVRRNPVAAMRTVNDEAAAYMAQCVYARSKSPQPHTERLYGSDEQWDRIFEVAWRLAGMILRGTPPSAIDIEVLRQAILQCPEYSTAGRTPAGYDGVPGM